MYVTTPSACFRLRTASAARPRSKSDASSSEPHRFGRPRALAVGGALRAACRASGPCDASVASLARTRTSLRGKRPASAGLGEEALEPAPLFVAEVVADRRRAGSAKRRPVESPVRVACSLRRWRGRARALRRACVAAAARPARRDALRRARTHAANTNGSPVHSNQPGRDRARAGNWPSSSSAGSPMTSAPVLRRRSSAIAVAAGRPRKRGSRLRVRASKSRASTTLVRDEASSATSSISSSGRSETSTTRCAPCPRAPIAMPRTKPKVAERRSRGDRHEPERRLRLRRARARPRRATTRSTANRARRRALQRIENRARVQVRDAGERVSIGGATRARRAACWLAFTRSPRGACSPCGRAPSARLGQRGCAELLDHAVVGVALDRA